MRELISDMCIRRCNAVWDGVGFGCVSKIGIFVMWFECDFGLKAICTIGSIVMRPHR